MADFVDLIKKADVDPESFEAIMREDVKLAEYSLTSDELSVIKRLDPQAIRTIAHRIRQKEVASSQACQACADAPRLERLAQPR